MTILLATGNPHKHAELAAIFGDDASARILALGDLPEQFPEPVEDGATLEENAYIKACETFAATGIASVADDTGLEVAALGGQPGVFSARYAGENATYAENCQKLLGAMTDVSDRSARFRTVICYVDQFRTLFAEGMVEGRILTSPRGQDGFGYDPLFQPEGSGKTFAEMDAAEKNAVSHRSRALKALKDMLTADR